MLEYVFDMLPETVGICMKEPPCIPMFQYDTNTNAICTITSNIITIILAPYSTFQIIPNASKCNTNYYNILGEIHPNPKTQRVNFSRTLFLQKFQTHSHSPKTHHLALRSANTNPLQVPLSPILIIVSHTPPSPASPAELVKLSAFRINLRIFPLGA